MVINAVTIESEQQLWQLKQRYGGELVRLSVAKELGLVRLPRFSRRCRSPSGWPRSNRL